MSNPTRTALQRAVGTTRPDWNVERIAAFAPLSGGYSNANYHFTYPDQDAGPLECVIRVPRAALTHDQRVAFHWELEYLQLLASHSPATPQVIGADRVRGTLLTRWQAGSLLHRAPRASQLQAQTEVQQLLNHLPTQSRNYDPLHDLSIIDTAPGWVSDLHVGTREWLHEQRHRFRPSHNDLNPYNLILRPGNPVLVLDWEMAGQNHPQFDRVVLQLGLAREQKDPAAAIKQTQSQLLSTLKSSEGRWLLRAYWLREYGWAVRQENSGNALEPVAAQRVLALEQLQYC